MLQHAEVESIRTKMNVRGIDYRRPCVACIGVYILDILGWPLVPTLARQRPQRIHVTAAGTAGGTSVDLGRLGADVRAIGAIGQDVLGDFLLQLLAKNGVGGEHMVRKPGVQTSATILPIPPSGDRVGWHLIGANGELDEDDIPWSVVAECDFVHLGGFSRLPKLDGAPSARVLKFAKSHGAVTTLDCLRADEPGLLEILAPCLPYADWFLPNEEEACALTGCDWALPAAERFLALGARGVIIKMGSSGCLIAYEDKRIRMPAFAVPVVDTTGCGDAFCAGVIVGLAQGWHIELAALFGTAAAALTAGGLGSDAGVRSFKETVDFMLSAQIKGQV